LRTLVISDIHLGSRLRHAVLTRPAALERLLVAIDDVDRLVLLGDTIELLEVRAEHAMKVAEPIIRTLGARLGPDREVLIVPGNHDRALVRDWVRARGAQLGTQNTIESSASAALERLTSWLAPARVSVQYPGAWLADGVWATHGHYLDLHLLPVSAWGISRVLPRDPAPRAALPIDYERSRRPSLGRTSRWLPLPLATLLDDGAEVVRAATMPRLLNPRIARLTSTVLGTQMQRASIPALTQVVRRLGVDAEWVVFGHVHRLGPLRGDDLEQWRGAEGGPRVVNSGSWMYEPILVHRAKPPHPYWPGGAVRLEPGRDPRPVGFLDDVPVEALRPARQDAARPEPRPARRRGSGRSRD
jgi:UDP-2,3-diacylglucosamine pyrophosphatase LpxH